MRKIYFFIVLFISAIFSINSWAQSLVYDVENTGASCSSPSLPSVSQLPSVSDLPDPFAWSDGSGRSTNFNDWSCRRNEIKEQIEYYEIGTKPEVSSSQVSASYSNGTLNITVTANGQSMSLSCAVALPSGSGPFPAVIGMSNPSGSLPESIFSSRNVARITFSHDQVTTYGSPSNNDPFFKLYPNQNVDNTGQYAAWSWGVSRIIDALEKTQGSLPIDLSKIAVTGCSYAGKMALFAGAFDERIALTIPQESGGGGAAAWRVSKTLGEVETLCATDYRWFRDDMNTNFCGNEDKLPIDHHELLAMVAPRAMLVIGNPDMVWLADEAGYVSCRAAHEVWKKFGIADRFGFSFVGHGDHCNLPSSQYDEVEAFVDKFLLGNTSVNTDVTIHSFSGVNYEQWYDDWLNLASSTSANAGSDQTVFDSDENGSELVTLNGSGSSAADGASITSYGWTENGSQIATGVNPTVTLSVGTHTITLTVTDNNGGTDTDDVTVVLVSGSSVPVSINVGGSATGSFLDDQYYSSGSTYTNSNTISTSQISSDIPSDIFLTERYGDFSYTIPNLEAGSEQTVSLYFVETYLSSAGERVFNVSANGAQALSNYDIYAAAGGADIAIAETFNITANSSGEIVLEFSTVTENPKVCGISFIENGSGTVTTQSPYNGSAAAIPGTIYTVEFDNGGADIAYYDSDSGNSGDGDRSDTDVDTEARISTGNVGWIVSGEWLEYTVNVASAGTYTLTADVASTGTSGSFHVEFDGNDVSGTISVPNTGDWGTFEDVSTDISLSAGEQIMRIYMDGSDFNIGSLVFSGGNAVIPVTGVSLSYTDISVDAGDSFALSASVLPSNASNTSVSWSSSNANIASVSSSGVVSGIAAGMCTITSTTADGGYTASANVTVQNASTGNYTITVRAKGVTGDENLNLLVDGTLVESWTMSTSYSYYTVSTVITPYTIELEFDNDGGDNDVQVDYIDLDGTTYQAEDQESNTAVYQDGSCGGSYSEMMHCDGIITFNLSIADTPEDYEISVRALGIVGDEHMNVNVGGTLVADFTLSTSYSDYTVSTSLTGNIEVEYDNDGEDRDMQVDYIIVDGVTLQAEDQESNTAVYQDGSCGGSYSEMMHCDGAITFSSLKAAHADLSKNTIELDLYPNPANLELNIVLSNTSAPNAIIELYTITGVKMNTYTIDNKETGIDISQLSSGIYLIKANNDGEIITRKFMKE